MARKPPRSRRNPSPNNRFPGKGRSRATPRTRRAAASSADASRHAPKGARPRLATVARKKSGLAGVTRKQAVARKQAGRKAKPATRRSPRFTPPDPERVKAVLAGLCAAYPDAFTELKFQSPLQLLIATILSAQCTDDRVNQVTPGLFARYRDANAFAHADRAELEEQIRSTGFYRNKAKSIQACCTDIVEKHGGEVPRTLDELVALHGVGRKTANVVLGNAFGIPGLVVDTHVTRLANRLGLTNQKDAVKIEHALMPLIPREDWTVFSHWLILHGRRVCNARIPFCSRCPVAAHCPRAGVTRSQ